MSHDTEPSPPRRIRRRWLQFNLSSLLLVMLLVAVLLAWKREPISRWVESLWIIPAEAAADDLSPPPMVMIQVMIAEVEGTSPSGGVELELRRSALFDSSAGDGRPVRGLTALAFGGLTLSASGDNVLAELRKLHRVDVVSRPQTTTMNGQPAYVQVGQLVQGIRTAPSKLRAKWGEELRAKWWWGEEPEGEQPEGRPADQPTPIEHVGLSLEVTPHVSKDGVALDIDVENSELAPAGDSVPVSPRINTTAAQTTITTTSGQTVVLGGMITSGKKELVIILTPRVIRSAAEAALEAR